MRWKEREMGERDGERDMRGRWIEDREREREGGERRRNQDG